MEVIGERKTIRRVFGPAFEQRSRSNSPPAEHVVRSEHLLVVEEDFGESVQPIKNEINMLVLECGRVNLEGGAVLPVGQPNPLQTRLVVAVKRIGDQVIGGEIGLHYARNLGSMPAADFGMIRGLDGPKLPCRIQRLHGSFSSVQRREVPERNVCQTQAADQGEFGTKVLHR